VLATYVFLRDKHNDLRCEENEEKQKALDTKVHTNVMEKNNITSVLVSG
jgi:hypothetical protein